MPTSVMPKGVEHSEKQVICACRPVMPTSVMPKGVEHKAYHFSIAAVLIMPTSVMPKGVEHERLGRSPDRGDAHAHLCDAERR